MEIKVKVENGKVPVTVMHIDGNVDGSTYDAFLAKARELIKEGAHYILMDLTHTAFMSSAGLRAINTIYNELRSLHPDANLSDEDVKKGIASGTYKSPHLKLLNPSRDVHASLTATGFDLFLEIHTDYNSAIASY
ncbi:MAG: STAS domain-containing protein [Verrucomicrobiae bacterium]|nr:STAS domain-containing protein [Verrucomicrobiae bacterium]